MTQENTIKKKGSRWQGIAKMVLAEVNHLIYFCQRCTVIVLTAFKSPTPTPAIPKPLK